MDDEQRQRLAMLLIALRGGGAAPMAAGNVNPAAMAMALRPKPQMPPAPPVAQAVGAPLRPQQ